MTFDKSLMSAHIAKDGVGGNSDQAGGACSGIEIINGLMKVIWVGDQNVGQMTRDALFNWKLPDGFEEQSAAYEPPSDWSDGLLQLPKVVRVILFQYEPTEVASDDFGETYKDWITVLLNVRSYLQQLQTDEIQLIVEVRQWFGGAGWYTEYTDAYGDGTALSYGSQCYHVMIDLDDPYWDNFWPPDGTVGQVIASNAGPRFLAGLTPANNISELNDPRLPPPQNDPNTGQKQQVDEEGNPMSEDDVQQSLDDQASDPETGTIGGDLITLYSKSMDTGVEPFLGVDMLTIVVIPMGGSFLSEGWAYGLDGIFQDIADNGTVVEIDKSGDDRVVVVGTNDVFLQDDSPYKNDVEAWNKAYKYFGRQRVIIIHDNNFPTEYDPGDGSTQAYTHYGASYEELDNTRGDGTLADAYGGSIYVSADISETDGPPPANGVFGEVNDNISNENVYEEVYGLEQTFFDQLCQDALGFEWDEGSADSDFLINLINDHWKLVSQNMNDLGPDEPDEEDDTESNAPEDLASGAEVDPAAEASANGEGE